jgi:hypothetical protein
LVLRVVNVLPQPQVTVVITCSGWIPLFMVSSLVGTGSPSVGVNRSRTSAGDSAKRADKFFKMTMPGQPDFLAPSTATCQ